MAQDGRYPSPELTSSAHPYHSNAQQVSNESHQQLQNAATAIMHEAHTDNNSIPQAFQQVANYGSHFPTTPQQLAQQTLEVDGVQVSEGNAKKTKVSRACDECRRKKVRCDAESDQTGVQCSNCKRLGIQCEFTRQPQKRGPSKGYIRELAERVSRLEYPGQPSPDGHFDPQNYGGHVDFSAGGQTQVHGQVQRKRTHSNMDSGNYEQLQEYARAPGSPFASTGNAIVSAPIYDLPELNTLNGSQVVPSTILEGYGRYIHTVFPLMLDARMQVLDDQVPQNLRQAYVSALTVAVNSFSTTVSAAETKQAVERCMSIQKNRRHLSDPLFQAIYLQALVLMAIADEVGGPTTSAAGFWLGCAVTNAHSLRASATIEPGESVQLDPSKLLRRSWLCLVVLDRWHAAAMCTATLIQDEDVRLTGDDQLLTGSSAYHIQRVSLALGHLSNMFLRHERDLLERPEIGRVLTQLMQGEVERIFESVESLFPQLPAVHLAYLHLKLLSDKATEWTCNSSGSSNNDSSALDAALSIVQLITLGPNDHAGAVTSFFPLQHHIAGLAAVTIAASADSVNESISIACMEALRQLVSLCDRYTTPPTHEQSICLAPAWAESLRAYISSRHSGSYQLSSTTAGETGDGGKVEGGIQSPSSAGAKQAGRGGLDHLAAAAVGADNNKGNGGGVNTGPSARSSVWRGVLSNGYLASFGDGAFGPGLEG